MTYRLAWSGPARRYLDRLDRNTQERVLRRLQQLLTNPYSPQSKPLRASNFRSARVGAWRIIFVVNEEAQEIWVQAIGPRGQVYREL